MMHNKALFGLFSGVLLVVLTLIGVALLNVPAGNAARGAEAVVTGCAIPGSVGEKGYGLPHGAGPCAVVAN